MTCAPAQNTQLLRPTWAEVSLPLLRANMLKLRLEAAARDLMFVVKADAYGHGARECALYAEADGLCDGFGVSCIEEGIHLRQCGIKKPILVLGSIYPPSAFEEALDHNLAITLASLDAARELEAHALRAGVVANCHVKVDTGMGRIGSRRPSAIKIMKFVEGSPGLRCGGIYTHLSSADTDTSYTRLQLRHFSDTIEDCRALGLDTGVKHAASSYAAVNIPESRWDMVRPGLACYGLLDGFAPALTLKTRIVFLKDVRPGASISYNRTLRCRRLTRVATLPIGYGDGYSRRLSNIGEVLVRGRRCRILGSVTMDMTMVDVTDVAGVSVGDEAVLIGRQQEDEITAGDIAQLTGTIPYEVVTCLGKRVPRVYKK